MDKLQQKLNKRFGDKYKVVSKHPTMENRAIVTDGTYEYIVTTKTILDVKSFDIKIMTKDSKIKRYNEMCCNDVSVVDLYNNGSAMYISFVHNPTGYKRTSAASPKIIKNICVSISKAANINKLFINRCVIKYGEKFSYEKTEYEKCNKNVIITCPIHGDFNIWPNTFLQNKHGCPKCGNESRPAYTKKSFIENCAYNIGYIYIIECVSQVEKFIKIGITSNANLKNRFPRKASMPYEYNAIMIIGYNPSNIFDFETESHRHFSEYKYTPNIFFHGSTECFDISIKDEAICFIQKLLLNCTSQI